MDFDIETVSDVLSLLFKMDEQTDMHFEAEKDRNGNYIPSTLKISFAHPAINQKLCTYLRAKQVQADFENNEEKPSIEERQEFENNMEEIRNHLLDDSMIVKKGTTGISVKLYPN